MTFLEAEFTFSFTINSFVVMKNILALIVLVFVSAATLLAGNTGAGPSGCTVFWSGDRGQFNASTPDGGTIQTYFLSTVFPANQGLYTQAWGADFTNFFINRAVNEGWVIGLSYGTAKNSGKNGTVLCSGTSWTGYWISLKKGNQIYHLAKYSSFTGASSDNYCYNSGDYRPNGLIVPYTPSPPQCNWTPGTVVVSGNSNTAMLFGAINVTYAQLDNGPITTVTNNQWSQAVGNGPHTLKVYGCSTSIDLPFVVNAPPPPAACNLLIETSDTTGRKWALEVSGSNKLKFVFSWAGNTKTVSSTTGSVTWDPGSYVGEVSVKILDQNVNGCSTTASVKFPGKVSPPSEVYEGSIYLDPKCTCDSANLTYYGPQGSKLILKARTPGATAIEVKAGETKNLDFTQRYGWSVSTTDGSDVAMGTGGNGAAYIDLQERTISNENCVSCKKNKKKKTWFGRNWWWLALLALGLILLIFFFPVGLIAIF